MALKWQYRSDSATQARYATALRDMTRIQSSTAITLVTGPTGTFGTTYLQAETANNGAYITWPGLDNVPVGVTALSVLLRLIPAQTGNPSTICGVFGWNSVRDNNQGGIGGFGFTIDTSSKFRVTGGKKTGSGSEYFNDMTFATALTLTQNVPTDIWFVWDGTTGAGKAELWQAQNGNAPTKISTGTASAAMVAMVRGACGTIITADQTNLRQNLGKFHYNELAIFDTAIDPSVVYGARSDFITAAAYEGYSFTSLSAAQVQSGVAYGPGPGTLTGTGVMAAAATTKIGVAANDGTGTYDGSERYTDFGNANIRSGQSGAYNSTSNNRTGTCVAAAAATTKHGVTADDGTGTYRGADLWTSLAASTILSGNSQTQDGSTVSGTAVRALAATTKHGVAADDGTGTYRGADLWDALAANKILSGNTQTQDGSVVTGTAVAAAAATTKIGVTANDGVGTYDGSDRWTSPRTDQLASGVQLKSNSTTVNLTGTLESTTVNMVGAVLLGQELSCTLKAEI